MELNTQNVRQSCLRECYNFVVETRRSFGSGHFDYVSPMQEGGDIAPAPRAASRLPLFFTAGLSVCVLGLAVTWSIFGRDNASSAPAVMAAALQSTVDTSAEPDIAAIAAHTQMTTADIGMIGPAVAGELIAQYQTLKEGGVYTPETANAVAQKLGDSVSAPVPYKQYAVKDLKMGADSSYEGMLAYRGNLKAALEPIASLKELEIGVYAAYVESHDPQYLEKLRAIASAYDAATAAAAALTVPPDAAALHAGILNAMGQFGASLQALADHADDPFTSIVLLKTYNEAESAMISSFNELAKYFAHHSQP